MSARDSRIKDYKNSGKHEEMRRRRAEGSVELRKAKKEENLMKRRNIAVEDSDGENTDPNSAPSPVKDPTSPEKAVEMTLEECAEVLASATATTGQTENAVESVRRKLSRSNNPPIQKILSLGLVGPLVGVLERGLSGGVGEKAAFEAAWALTNIVSGTAEETKAVVAGGGVGPLVLALSSPALNIAEQAAWALGNIAGDGPSLRDAVLHAGVLGPMIELAKRPDVSVEFLRTLAWAFSNFCRHKNPGPSIELIRGLLPYMGELLRHPDKAVRVDTAWAFSYVTDGDDAQISAALEYPILPLMMACLESEDKSLKAPALRALGNIVTGNDSHTQAVIDTGVLRSAALGELLKGEGNLAKEAVWMVSNVLAGTEPQIAAVIDAGIVSRLPHLLSLGEHKVRHEAAWAVLNLTTGGSPSQVMSLVTAGGLGAMSEVLLVKDARVSKLLLEALEHVFAKAAKLGKLTQVAEMFEEADGLDKLEQLQTHEDEGIYEKAAGLVSKFFCDDEETEETQDADDTAPIKYEL